MTDPVLYHAKNNATPSNSHIDTLNRLEGDLLTGNDLHYSLLVGMDEKGGTDITFETSDNPDVEAYAETMTDLGVNVFVDYEVSNGSYDGELIATVTDLDFNELNRITGRDSNLSCSDQVEKARMRGFPEEAIGWYLNDDVLTVVPSKLRGLYDTEIEDPFMIPFSIKADQEVFDRYTEEYGMPRIEAIRRIEEDTGRELMPDTPEPEMFWQLVREDQMPFDTGDLQALLEKESL